MKLGTGRVAGLIVVLFYLLTGPVLAENTFNSYNYDSQGEATAAPDAVVTDRVVTGSQLGITNLNSPSDLFVVNGGNIYIADTGNNRIVVLDKELHLIREITAAVGEDGPFTFQKPQGIFLHENDLYIADTGNARIVVMDQEDRLVRILEAPVSSSLPGTFEYKPTKVLVDTAGRIFVTSSGFNMGLIELDKNGDFVGCLGANAVTFSIQDYFWRLVSTREQTDRMASFVPTEYNNINIDEDNFIYVTSNSYSQSEYEAGTASPLRKLNAKGYDILRKNGAVKPYGDVKVMSTGTYRGASSLVDVCTLSYGMYAVLDANRCRTFVYNSGGELLFAFGSPGQVKGCLQVPTALEYAGGVFYVLDSGKMSLSTYTLSDYGAKLYTTAQYHYTNRYEEEEALWKEIFQMNSNSNNALTGMGKAAYRSQDFSGAMYYFRLASDRTNYSAAFKMYRMRMMGQVVPYLMTGMLLLAGVLLIRVLWRRRHPARIPDSGSYYGTLRYSRHVIFHPFDGFWDLKREKRGSMKAALTLLGLACVAMAVYSRFTGFIFFTVEEEKYNLLLELLKVAAPVLLFCVCNWCVTSLMNGEGRFYDIVMASSYALTPLVFLLPIATLLSNVLLEDEGALFQFFVVLAALWTLALLICANKQIHDYSMSKTWLVLLITVVVMVVVLFLTVLAFALLQQFLSFIQDLETEISLRM